MQQQDTYLRLHFPMICFLNPFLLLTCRAGHHWNAENKKKRDSVYIFAHFASKATHAQQREHRLGISLRASLWVSPAWKKDIKRKLWETSSHLRLAGQPAVKGLSWGMERTGSKPVTGLQRATQNLPSLSIFSSPPLAVLYPSFHPSLIGILGPERLGSLENFGLQGTYIHA